MIKEDLNPGPIEVRTSGTSSRMQWLDVAKGIAIILVVIGHALGGILDSSTIRPDNWVKYSFAAIYVFHMPLFFLLSAYLVEKRLRNNRKSFVKSMFTKIAIPYFIWSAVQLVVIWGAGSLVNKPVNDLQSSLLAIPYWPPSQFWFLYALFLLHVVSLCIVGKINSVFLPIIGIAMMFTARMVQLPIMISVSFVTAPYYFFGIYLGSIEHKLPTMVRSFKVTAAVTALALALLSVTILLIFTGLSQDVLANPRAGQLQAATRSFEAMPAALVMILAILLISHHDVPNLSRMLARLGQLAMPIFVLHIMVVAGGRIALGKLMPNMVGPMVFALTCLGLILPIIAFHILNRMKLAKPLGLA